MKRPLELAATLAAAGLCGCTHAHLTESYGQSYAAAFSQQAPPRPRVQAPVSGLDSQEAAIISGSYRKSIAPKDAQVKDQPVLIVAPPNQQVGGYGMGMTLAPSVPKDK